MPFKYLEHVGDAAIEACGETLEHAFAEAARAMFALMIKTKAVLPDRNVEIEVNAASLEELLTAFLNELLSRQDIEDVVFFDCWVKEIISMGIEHTLKGTALGINAQKVKGKLGHEVKGASYLGLKIDETPSGVKVRCVVDM
jgi:SHS2 domain-containing protein